MKYLRGVMDADFQQGIAMSANYARGSTVADFPEGTATGKNAGQSLKADCGELAARALLARFVLQNAVTSTGGCNAAYRDAQTLSVLSHNITSTPGHCGHECATGAAG